MALPRDMLEGVSGNSGRELVCSRGFKVSDDRQNLQRRLLGFGWFSKRTFFEWLSSSGLPALREAEMERLWTEAAHDVQQADRAKPNVGFSEHLVVELSVRVQRSGPAADSTAQQRCPFGIGLSNDRANMPRRILGFGWCSRSMYYDWISSNGLPALWEDEMAQLWNQAARDVMPGDRADPNGGVAENLVVELAVRVLQHCDPAPDSFGEHFVQMSLPSPRSGPAADSTAEQEVQSRQS